MANDSTAAHEAQQVLADQKSKLLEQIRHGVEMQEEGEDLVRQAVDDLRHNGPIGRLATWDEIAEAAKIEGKAPGQAAYQRYGKRVPGK